jgi:hypothetical protein
MRQLTKANAAYTVLAEISVRASADFAAVVFSGGILGRTLLFDFHGSLCHCVLLTVG